MCLQTTGYGNYFKRNIISDDILQRWSVTVINHVKDNYEILC